MTIEEKKEFLLKALGETWEKMLSNWKWKTVKDNSKSFVLEGNEGPYIFTPYLVGCIDAWDSELIIEYTPEDDMIGIYLKYRPIKEKFKEDILSVFEKHSPFKMTLSFDDKLTPTISRKEKVAPGDFQTYLNEFKKIYDENYPLFYMVTVSAIEWYDGFRIRCAESWE